MMAQKFSQCLHNENDHRGKPFFLYAPNVVSPAILQLSRNFLAIFMRVFDINPLQVFPILVSSESGFRLLG